MITDTMQVRCCVSEAELLIDKVGQLQFYCQPCWHHSDCRKCYNVTLHLQNVEVSVNTVCTSIPHDVNAASWLTVDETSDGHTGLCCAFSI